MTELLLIWLATSGVGLLLSLVGLSEARQDLTSLRGIPRNGRWMIARHQLIRYGLRTIMSIALIAAAFTSDRYLIAWLLILANVGLSLTTLSDLVTAAFLRRSLRREVEAGQ